MAVLLKSRTISVSIRRNPKAVYAFVSNVRNLPRWATAFCRSIRRSNAGWIITTPQGPATIRLARKNALGVLDHFVSPSPGVEVFVPMRVVPNGQGCEVIFTLFRQPGMSKQNDAKDAKLVAQDLSSLKRVMEQ